MRHLRIAVFGFTLLWGHLAFALGFTVSKEQMMVAIQPFFPYPVMLGDWHVQLKEPDLGFMAKEQAMSLDLKMDVASGKETMLLAGKIRGQVVFDAKTQQLQLVKPRVEKLNVLSGKITGMDDTLNNIRTMFGRDLPVIVLFDIKQLSGGMAMFSPSSLTIVDNGVSIAF